VRRVPAGLMLPLPTRDDPAIGLVAGWLSTQSAARLTYCARSLLGRKRARLERSEEMVFHAQMEADSRRQARLAHSESDRATGKLVIKAAGHCRSGQVDHDSASAGKVVPDLPACPSHSQITHTDKDGTCSLRSCAVDLALSDSCVGLRSFASVSTRIHRGQHAMQRATDRLR
jgi:hypothetical protein